MHSHTTHAQQQQCSRMLPLPPPAHRRCIWGRKTDLLQSSRCCSRAGSRSSLKDCHAVSSTICFTSVDCRGILCAPRLYWPGMPSKAFLTIFTSSQNTAACVECSNLLHMCWLSAHAVCTSSAPRLHWPGMPSSALLATPTSTQTQLHICWLAQPCRLPDRSAGWQEAQ